jgi:ferrochelatase
MVIEKNRLILLVNFGGPRQLQEVPVFLKALLTDQDVVRTNFPKLLHNLLFSRVARKRSVKVAKDYELIGGKSPIFEDTERVAAYLREKKGLSVATFHRYLPATHAAFIQAMQTVESEIYVFPMFPQFSFATTGSIARWFSKHLSTDVVNQMKWIKSYAAHPTFISAWQNVIRAFLQQQQLKEEEVILLFSAHGLPKQFSATGDIYEAECQLSFEKVAKGFPKAFCRLSYQSKFGKGEWLRPYTNEVCEEILSWSGKYKHVVIVPISFTSDHIETLFEVEYEYLPALRKEGVMAYRCPALNHDDSWMAAILEILEDTNLMSTQMLVRKG